MDVMANPDHQDYPLQQPQQMGYNTLECLAHLDLQDHLECHWWDPKVNQEWNSALHLLEKTITTTDMVNYKLTNCLILFDSNISTLQTSGIEIQSGGRSSLDELKALRELKQLKDTEETTFGKINIFENKILLFTLFICSIFLCKTFNPTGKLCFYSTKSPSHSLSFPCASRCVFVAKKI